MTNEEALTIIKGYKIYSLGHSNHSEAFDIAEECIQHCIDEENALNNFMLELTPEENKSIDDYIKRISVDTGVNVWKVFEND